MNRRKFSAAVLSLSLAGASALATCFGRAGSAQEARPAPTPKPSKVFQEARAVNDTAAPGPEAFEFEAHGFGYHINRNGNGWRKKGKKTRRFNLRLESGELGRVYFHEYGGRLLLVCEADDGEGGWGFVTLLEQPTMRARWRQTFPASEVGRPLRDGRHLYVTGNGFVGRLDLDTGTFDWRHADLEDVRGDEPKPLGAFDQPELKGDAVLFRERPVYNPRRTLVVKKKTGKIMSVE